MKGRQCVCGCRNAAAGLVLGDFEFGIVKRKARQLVGRGGFKPQDIEDLEQDLMLRLIQGLQSFDPKIAHQKSFVTAIVERAVATILRDTNAAKRDRGDQQSLEILVEVTGESPTQLGNTIGDREYNRRRGRHPRTQKECDELHVDLESVINSLPNDQQQLAEKLKSKSIAESAREFGLPRTTLNDAVRRLQVRFSQSHMEDHL
ncbi:MAG: sigma-70 family RNA polymerase sigma factor [Planctomycetaceae bacterium]|nr:sigma-70 family RNA polymerase sigma factor [Planctomycetaceae bacterium]